MSDFPKNPNQLDDDNPDQFDAGSKVKVVIYQQETVEGVTRAKAVPVGTLLQSLQGVVQTANPETLPALGQSSLTVTGISQGLSAGTPKSGSLAIPAGASYARIAVIDGSIYATTSGPATSSDEPVAAGSVIRLYKTDDINTFQVLRKDGAPRLVIQYRGQA